MTFTVETDYTSGTMAVMARALRKTLRKRRSRRFHVFGWIVTALTIILIVGVQISLFYIILWILGS